MSVLATAIGWTLLHSLWQGALVGALACIALACLRHAHPRQRYAVAGFAMLACLLWPAMELAAQLRLAAGKTDAGATGLAGGINGDAALSGMEAWLPWLAAAWLLCVTALTLRNAAGLAWLARARRHGGTDPAWQRKLSRMAQRLGIARHVSLRIVDMAGGPITAGWWRPVVLVPGTLLTGLPGDMLEALLAHELAHVRRHDFLFKLLQNVVEILLCHHPVVHWLSRRVEHERELLADDMAARLTGAPRQLALALSELEKLQFASRPLALAAHGGQLSARVRSLLGPAVESRNWQAVLPMLVLSLLLCSTWLNARAEAPLLQVDQRAVIDFKICGKPEWPKAALRESRTGTVSLKFLVSSKGQVIDANVVNSSGHRDLDRAASQGLARCIFQPARVRGKPVASWHQMKYVWVLQ